METLAIRHGMPLPECPDLRARHGELPSDVPDVRRLRARRPQEDPRVVGKRENDDLFAYLCVGRQAENARSCRESGLSWRPGRVYFLTLLEPLAGTTGLWPLPPGRPASATVDLSQRDDERFIAHAANRYREALVCRGQDRPWPWCDAGDGHLLRACWLARPGLPDGDCHRG